MFHVSMNPPARLLSYTLDARMVFCVKSPLLPLIYQVFKGIVF